MVKPTGYSQGVENRSSVKKEWILYLCNLDGPQENNAQWN